MDLFVTKSLNFKKTTAKGRTITGIASVAGNIDAAGDIVQPGAFRKAVADFHAGKSRARFLWQHLQMQPPTAKIVDLKELSRSELPAQLKADPDVTGGLQVEREYFKDEFSERVYQSVVNGAITEMSFAYDILDSEEKEVRGKRVRLLKSLELMDCSDVMWGCNSATIAAVKSSSGANRVNYFGISDRPVDRRWLDGAWLKMAKADLEDLQPAAGHQLDRDFLAKARRQLAELRID
jgi:uncharacterized protein